MEKSSYFCFQIGKVLKLGCGHQYKKTREHLKNKQFLFQVFVNILLMQNSEVFMFRKQNKQQMSIGSSSLSTSNLSQENSFIDNIFFNKKVFENPYNSSLRAMDVFFQRIHVKKLKIKELYMEIVVRQNYENSDMQIYKNVSQKNSSIEIDCKNKKLKEQLDFINRKISKEFPLYKQKVLQCPAQFYYKKYQTWLKQMGNINFLSLYMPIFCQATFLKSFSVSQKTLALMGYTLDEGALQFQKYKFNGLDFFDNYAYHIISLIYLNTLAKFIEAEMRGTLTREQVVAESQTFILNEMIGKNQRRIKVEMKIFMPSPFIICCQILNISRGQKFYDQSLEAQRRIVEESDNKKCQKLLNHIIKFPKLCSENGKHIVCNYTEIQSDK